MAEGSAAVQTPVSNFIFKLKLDGVDSAGFFTEASGLSSENQVIEHTSSDGQGKPLPQRFAGQVKWGNIVLKRGVDAKMELWKWRKDILDGKIEASRKDCTISVLDQTGAEVVTYAFIRAWPCKYSSPGLNANGNEILVEELELSHEGFVRSK
jgi:phage tail-like protein